jgi:hypothetical protein
LSERNFPKAEPLADSGFFFLAKTHLCGYYRVRIRFNFSREI